MTDFPPLSTSAPVEICRDDGVSTCASRRHTCVSTYIAPKKTRRRRVRPRVSRRDDDDEDTDSSSTNGNCRVPALSQGLRRRLRIEKACKLPRISRPSGDAGALVLELVTSTRPISSRTTSGISRFQMSTSCFIVASAPTGRVTNVVERVRHARRGAAVTSESRERRRGVLRLRGVEIRRSTASCGVFTRTRRARLAHVVRNRVYARHGVNTSTWFVETHRRRREY